MNLSLIGDVNANSDHDTSTPTGPMTEAAIEAAISKHGIRTRDWRGNAKATIEKSNAITLGLLGGVLPDGDGDDSWEDSSEFEFEDGSDPAPTGANTGQTFNVEGLIT